MQTFKKLPDPALCRTQRVVNDYWECLVDKSARVLCCQYALEFGFSHFCKHPNNRAFGDRGEAMKTVRNSVTDQSQAA